MKQLPAIIFCLCLFVPETARIIAGSFCAYSVPDENAAPVCACMFNNVPATMAETAFPDKHKEILQQTDWQYLAPLLQVYPPAIYKQTGRLFFEFPVACATGIAGSIFHPPCFS